jgi:hypothetical protein
MEWAGAARRSRARHVAGRSRRVGQRARPGDGAVCRDPSQRRSGIGVDWQDWSRARRRMVSSHDRSACPERSRSGPRPKERSAKAEGEIGRAQARLARRGCERREERRGRRQTGGGSEATDWGRAATDRGEGRRECRDRPGQDTYERCGEGRSPDGPGRDLLTETRQASTSAGEDQGAVRREQDLWRPRPAVVRRSE